MQTLLLCRLVALLGFSNFATSTKSPTSVLTSLGVNLSKYPLRQGNAEATCAVLEFLFPSNETFTSASALYTPLYEVPWSQTCWLTPACIMTPGSAQQLSNMMVVLSALKTKFAVRSGGHKPTPGFNSVGSDGVLLALQNLRKLAISADTRTVTVGTGNHWRDVYNYVKSYNVTVVGGREPMVGVGGLLLGGGLSLFYNSWGLALDQVSRFQIVLTDGTVLDATPSRNADLFQALKGGMSNFGIVIEFDLETQTDINTYYEVYEYSTDETPALLQAYGDYLADNTTDPKTSVEINIVSGYSAAFFGYLTSTKEPADFFRFRSIPTTATLVPPTNGSIDSVIFGVGGAATTLGSWVGASFSHKVNDANIMLASYDLIRNYSTTLPSTMYLTYVPQGILPNMVSVGNALNGGNLLGLSETPQAWIDIYMTYTYLNQTAQATNIINEFVSIITRKAEASGLILPYIFPNTASNDQRPLASFGARNFKTIQAAAAKYDPNGYMQTLQNDGYLISKET